MIKNLTLLAVAGLLLNTGCILDIGDSASDTNATTNNTSTDGTAGTTSGTTEGTGGTGGGTTTEGGSTTAPTTTAPTTGEPMTSSTSQGTTGGGSEFGNCGWNAANKYYGCDGEPGVEDPDGVSPIACPEPLPTAGDPCDMTTLVNNVGCCTPEGVNYYCSNTADGMIVIEMCN